MSDSSALLNQLADKLKGLRQERETLATLLAGIDAKIAKMAEVLGIDASAITGGSDHAPPQRRRQGRSREGTLTEFVLLQLAQADAGLTRRELAEAISQSTFEEQHRRNPNGLYNLLSRAVSRGEILEKGNTFYHASRPPLEDQIERDTGLNISLFPAPKGGSNG